MKFHNKNKLIAFEYLKEYSNINVPCLVYIDFMNKFEIQISDIFQDVITKWHDFKKKECEVLCEGFLKTFNETKSNQDVFSILDSFEDIINYINKLSNVKRHEIITPKMIETVVFKLKKGFRDKKKKLDSEIGILKHEKMVFQGLVDKSREDYSKMKSENEEIVSGMKEQILNLKLEVINNVLKKKILKENIHFFNIL
jgi:hypothetical protein